MRTCIVYAYAFMCVAATHCAPHVVRRCACWSLLQLLQLSKSILAHLENRFRSLDHVCTAVANLISRAAEATCQLLAPSFTNNSVDSAVVPALVAQVAALNEVLGKTAQRATVHQQLHFGEAIKAQGKQSIAMLNAACALS